MASIPQLAQNQNSVCIGSVLRSDPEQFSGMKGVFVKGKAIAVCTENLNPDVVVVKSAKDGV
jgi:hypothetical protein